MIEKFYAGGPFMWPILILMVADFALSFERFITLFKAGSYICRGHSRELYRLSQAV